MGSWVALSEAHAVLAAAGWNVILSDRESLIYEKQGRRVTLAVRIRDGVEVCADVIAQVVDGVEMAARCGSDMVGLVETETREGMTALDEGGSDGTGENRPPRDVVPAYVLVVDRGSADRETVDEFYRALARFERAVGDEFVEHLPLVDEPGARR